MNTDNMSIAGETIDFGPCAFMDAYDPATVFSSIDEFGRYAYGNQPRIAQWNLARFAEAILPLLDPDEEKAIELANGAITGFWEPFQARYLAGMREKLGLASAEEGDLDLAKGLLDAMQAGRADFTLTFRRLAALAAGEAAEGEVRELFAEPGAITSWLPQWRARLARDPLEPAERGHRMRLASPAVIPRNHLVEEALEAAIARDDYGPFDRLHAALARPYEDDPEMPGSRHRRRRARCPTAPSAGPEAGGSDRHAGPAQAVHELLLVRRIGVGVDEAPVAGEVGRSQGCHLGKQRRCLLGPVQHAETGDRNGEHHVHPADCQAPLGEMQRLLVVAEVIVHERDPAQADEGQGIAGVEADRPQ
jgi:hypothetical protein